MYTTHIDQVELFWLRDDAQQMAQIVNDFVIMKKLEVGYEPQIMVCAAFIAVIYKRKLDIAGGDRPPREFININTSGIPDNWRELEEERRKRRWWKRFIQWAYGSANEIIGHISLSSNKPDIYG